MPLLRPSWCATTLKLTQRHRSPQPGASPPSDRASLVGGSVPVPREQSVALFDLAPPLGCGSPGAGLRTCAAGGLGGRWPSSWSWSAQDADRLRCPVASWAPDSARGTVIRDHLSGGMSRRTASSAPTRSRWSPFLDATSATYCSNRGTVISSPHRNRPMAAESAGARRVPRRRARGERAASRCPSQSTRRARTPPSRDGDPRHPSGSREYARPAARRVGRRSRSAPAPENRLPFLETSEFRAVERSPR